MTKLPLSQAYPFMASSFVLVIFGGAWLFLEPIGLGKILGTFLIIAGVIIIGFDRP
jgi:undecaprenyl phosphate-alpha-L-ara4N flippase subunit ArnE